MPAAASTIATPRPLWIAGAIAPGLAIVVCLVLYPIGLALWVSLTSSAGALTLQHYVDFFASGDSYRALLRTLGLALATTAASLLLSIPLGYLGRIPGSIGTLVRVLVSLPLAVPVLIAGYSLALFLCGERAVQQSAGARAASPVRPAFDFLHGRPRRRLHLAVLSLHGTSDHCGAAGDRPQFEQAAASTGANPWQVFARVTLPLIAPAALTGSILTFVSTFGTFSIPLIMGRGGDVLSVMAYRKVSGAFDWPVASTIVIVMAVIQIAVLVGMRRSVVRWTRRG